MPKRGRDYRDWLLEELKDPDKAANYLIAVFEEEDPDAILLALRDVAEARQMSRIAKEAGVSRESIYRMLSDTGNPRFNNLVAIAKALGFRLSIEPLVSHTEQPPRSDSTAGIEQGMVSTGQQSSPQNSKATDIGVYKANRSSRVARPWEQSTQRPSARHTSPCAEAAAI